METRGLYGEIAANRRRSLLLVLSLSAVLGAFGAALGALYGHAGAGLTVAIAVAGCPPARQLVRRRVHDAGRELRAARRSGPRPGASQRRPRDGDRLRDAGAGGVRDRRLGAQRIRHRPRSAARDRGRHDGPGGEAGPGRAPGSDRPRARARPQLRHPVHHAGRRHGGRDRAAGRLRAAAILVGRTDAVAEPRFCPAADPDRRSRGRTRAAVGAAPAGRRLPSARDPGRPRERGR